MLVAYRLAGLSALEALCRGQRAPAISPCGDTLGGAGISGFNPSSYPSPSQAHLGRLRPNAALCAWLSADDERGAPVDWRDVVIDDHR